MKFLFRASALCCVGLCLFGCGRAINRSVERRIREALPGLLGSARLYHVHVDGAVQHTLGGRLQHVNIDADDLQMTNGLLLDHLHLALDHVDYDTDSRRLRHIDTATFTATVGQNSLDEFLAGESPQGENLRRIRVSLNAHNRMTLTAEREALGIGVPFQMAGPLRLATPTRLEIDPTRLTVVGIPITGVVLRFLKSHFESAVDLSSLPFPIQLTSLTTAPGALTLSGAVDVEALVARSALQSTP